MSSVFAFWSAVAANVAAALVACLGRAADSVRAIAGFLDRLLCAAGSTLVVALSLVVSAVSLTVNAAIAAIIGAVALFAYFDRGLPSFDELLLYRPIEINRVMGPDGRVVRRFGDVNRIFTPLPEIPDVVVSAFLSAEDKNFFSHAGVDGVALARAIMANITSVRHGGGFVQGGSTIVQQVIKNFVIGNDRSIERKIKEAILAVRIGDDLPKERILEIYLNEVFLGQGAYGVEAASDRYFGAPLDQITLAQAAYLAALPKAPSEMHPVRDVDRAIDRRNYVLLRMMEDGHIDEEDFRTAKAEPLDTVFSSGAFAGDWPHPPAPPLMSSDAARGNLAVSNPSSSLTAPSSAEAPTSFLPAFASTPPGPDWGYWVDEAVRMVRAEMPAASLYHGGWVVKTSIDAEMQSLAERALRDGLGDWWRMLGVYPGAVRQFYAREEMATPDGRAVLKDAIAAAAPYAYGVAIVGSLDKAGAVILVVGEAATLTGEVLRIDAEAFRSWRPAKAIAQGLEDVRAPIRPGQLIHFSRRVAPIAVPAPQSAPVRDSAPAASVGSLAASSATAAPVTGHVAGPVTTPVTTPVTGPDGLALARLEAAPGMDGAVVVMEASTGRVLAMVGGISYDRSNFNRATSAVRQPGSALKPFTYLAYLEAGGSIDDTVLDEPISVRVGDKIWSPRNSSGGWSGPMPAWRALALSRNLPAVRVGMALGGARMADVWSRFGIYQDTRFAPSYLLGARETTLTDLTAAYAAIANGGMRVYPTVIDQIVHRDGREIFRAHRPEQALTPSRHDNPASGGALAGPVQPTGNVFGRFPGDTAGSVSQGVHVDASVVAYGEGAKYPASSFMGSSPDADGRVTDARSAAGVTEMLRLTVTEGTARRAFKDLDIEFAGKTGTSNDSRDAWFIGYTADLVFGCYVGRDDFRPMGDGAYGGTLCAPVIADIVRAWHEGRPTPSFAPYRRAEPVAAPPIWFGASVGDSARAGASDDGSADASFPRTLPERDELDRFPQTGSGAASGQTGAWATPGGLY